MLKIPDRDRIDEQDFSTALPNLRARWSRRASLGAFATILLTALPTCARSQPKRRSLSIGLFRDANQIDVPPGVDLVQTSGFARIGWGAARYSYDPTIDRQIVARRPFDTFLTRNGRGFRLAEPVPDVTAFGAVGDDKTDDAPAIQRAIDSLKTIGGTVLLPSGRFRIASTLIMRTGVNIAGVGASYGYVDDANVLGGSWLVYTGDASQPAVRFRSVHDISFSDLGVGSDGRQGTTLIEIGSNNKPATKRLSFQRCLAFNADWAVRWGLGNSLTRWEQCDEIVFDQFSTHSCRNGFAIDAANAADFSSITGGSLNSLVGIGFDLRASGFMRIENVAASFALAGGTMFKISSSGADPLRIIGCQSEGAAATFLDYAAANDQGIVSLESNVINQPIKLNGIIRVTSRDNYINTEVATVGFVRWRSYDDNFAGIYGQPGYVEQIKIGEGGQFRATSLKDALSYFGRYLPIGFIIENSEPGASGGLSQFVVRKGVLCRDFVINTEVSEGQTIQPTTDNQHAYLVVAGGRTGTIEPLWPTAPGSTVTSGSARLKEIGPNAMLKDFQQITL